MTAVTSDSGNLYADIPETLAAEEFRALLSAPQCRIERIVSRGQATPAGEWLVQDRAEWVILLEGSAALRFEGEAGLRTLGPGDYLAIPARRRHRVEATARGEPTIWLAVHH